MLMAIRCPVCRSYELKNIHDKCEVCGWAFETEDYQDHSFCSAANAYPVTEYRKKWVAREIPEPTHYDENGNILTHDEFMKTVEFIDDDIFGGILKKL